MEMNLLTDLREALEYAFVQRALLAGFFIALSCSSLGLFLVLQRFSLIGDGLAHVAFGTIGLGLLLNAQPLVISVPLVMLASVWVLLLSERTRIHGDAAIGLVSALGVASGVMLASVGKGFNIDLFSYLFGSILAISDEEVILSIILSLVVVGVLGLFFHELFAIIFDEEFARVLGIRTRRVNLVLMLCTALTVVLGIRVVGTMLVSSLIVFPAVAALQLARNFKTALLLSALVAVGSVMGGIFLSFAFDLPTGATIVFLNFFFFLCAYLAAQGTG